MKASLLLALALFAAPAMAQQPQQVPLPITITLSGPDYQMIVNGLAELPAKQSFSVLVQLFNAQEAARKAAMPKPAIPAAPPKPTAKP